MNLELILRVGCGFNVPSKSENILTDCWPMLDVAHTDFAGDLPVISSQVCYHPAGRLCSLVLRNVAFGQMSDLWALAR